MKLSSLIRRSLAMLVLLATLVSLVPNVFAAEDENGIPKELQGKELIAELDENGDLVYTEADESTKAAMRATSFNAQATQDFSKGARVAFFIDDSNTEGNTSYKAFTISDANIDNLTARGVTDFFVMTKNKAGTFSTTDLKNVITYAGTAANVYAWMHCALDNAYIAANEGSAQYHFRVGRKCNAYSSDSEYYDTRNGFVDLRLSAYRTYFNGLVDQVEACAGVDGVLLDSVKFGADYYGWDGNARTTMGTTAYNAAVVKLAAHHGYTYKTNSSGYYVYSGTTTADSTSLTTYVNANSTNAQTYYNYRASIITGFIKSVRSSLGSGLYLGVALEADWNNTYYIMSTYGQFPANFKSYVSNGFCVVKTFLNVLGSYTSSYYGSSSTASMGVDRAKKVAKYGCNVFVGMDGNWTSNSSNPYAWYDPIYYQSYWIYNSRFTVNGDVSYGGDILGAALYTAGNIGLMKLTVSEVSSTPTMTVDFVNPNMASYGMLGYFHKYNSTSAQFNFSAAGISAGGVKTVSGHMKYFANTTSSMGYVGAYASYDNATISAYGTGKFKVWITGLDVTYATLPFARISIYDNATVCASSSSTWSYTAAIPMYHHFVVSGHESCTSFNYTVKVSPDCTGTGYRIATCKTCGYDYVDVLATTGHSYTSVVTTEATCETTGLMTYTCSVCADTYTEEIAALGHDYQTVVTAPTCLDGGYTTYTCSRDASHTYVADETAAAGHTFVNGTCTVCGFTLAKLIHFKENSEENTWDWQIVGGSNLGFDTSTDGAMYGTANGMVQSYFYIEPSGIGDIDHTLMENDLIQIRIRVKTIQGTATTATPSISLETASGTQYGATISGDTIDLTTTEWQIVTIPVTGYTVGDTIEKIRINPFGEEPVAANVEIDYVFFGQEEGLPITVTFYNYDGKVLQTSMITPGTKATYYGETPIKPSSAGFIYTFEGWIATSALSLRNTGTVISDLSTVTFSADTALTASFSYVRGDTEPLDSDKHLVDNDGDLEDYIYDIEIDASTYGSEVTINKEYKTPMDIVIVMDRSSSIVYSANYNSDYKVTSASNLTTVLNKLDKTKPSGYYSATNWLGIDYVGAEDIQTGGYISYEDMRYNTSKSRWEVWQTITTSEAKTLFGSESSPGTYYVEDNDWTILCRPASVIRAFGGLVYHQEAFGSWVPVTQAYTDFIARRDESFADEWEAANGLAGYTASNVYFRIGVSRRAIMQESLNNFIDEIYGTLDQLSQGEYHTISIVSFGYGIYVDGKQKDDGSLGISCTPLKLVNSEDAATTNADNLKALHTCIDNTYAFGQTYTDEAMAHAAEIVAGNNSAERGASSIVILFTDGAPTHGATFQADVANTALSAAAPMKTNGTDVFAMGFMLGLNSAIDYGAMADNGYVDEANNFLHLLSSNYPNATTMSGPVDGGSSDAGYYFSTNDGSELGEHLAEVYITTDTTTQVQTSLSGKVEIRDVVTREWDVLKNSDGSWDVKVEKYAYEGLGVFADPETLDSSLYTLTVTELTDSEGNLTGETEIQVEWTDAPNAWLREAEEADDPTYLGYKILVTIGIQLDRDSTIGGNNIPTNTPDSGIFYPTNHDLDHYYDVPNVNVEIEYDYKVHDYFLDLYNTNAPFDLLDVLNSDDPMEYKLAVYQDLYTRTVDVDGLNNRFVNIEHFAGTDIYSEYLEAGTTEWAPSFMEPVFDFENDLSGIPVRYEVTPITGEIDSLGREAFTVKKPVRTASVNYYAPKYAVVDYHTTAVIGMGNETEAKLGSAVVFEDNGAFDSTGNNAQYTFRCDVDNGDEQSHILTDIETIGYTVTAINAPKGASSNAVSRTIHIIPANVVEYDYEVLSKHEYVSGSEFTGTWTVVGTYDNTKQNVDNEELHGYDSTLQASASTEPYSYGRSYMTTVSANVRDDDGSITQYNNNAALKFTFTGTGFDVISQTGPDEGVMIVEVYKAGTTTLEKRVMVDNYLANTTLYQVPVARVMDLEYGSYDVVIRAFYSDAFSHYVAPTTETTSNANVMTEKKLRSVLDLGENDLLDYTLSADRAKKSRALTATGYDVHVDGIRIYNTLNDELTASSNPVAYYAYGLANEINAQFSNVRRYMLDISTWKYDISATENLEGALYIASKGDTTNVSETDTGIHLSMDGIFNYETVDGVNYLIDVNDARVTHPVYKTDIYVEVSGSTCRYYCNDASGAKVSLTAKEVGAIIGQGKVVFYNSYYAVNSPKNEVYLNGTNGLAFNAKGATLLKISAKSIDGSAVVLQAYDWTNSKFVNVAAATSKNMEMYYDLTDYIGSNGDVVIRNLNDDTYTGVISICNIKVVGSTISAPSAAYKAIDLIQNPNGVTDCTHPELTFGEANDPTCVKAGNTEFWYCDDCETFYADEAATQEIDALSTLIAPTGIHSYVDGACSVCGAKEETTQDPIYNEDLSFIASISAGAQIEIIYTVTAATVKGYDSFYLEITKNVSDPIVTVFALDGENELVPFVNAANGVTVAYHANYTGINAKEMGDSFTAVLFAVAEDGTVYYGEASTMTIKDYLTAKIDDEASSDELKTLAVDMLNYGAAAQLYFGYNTENLVNADLTAEQSAYATTQMPSATDSIDISGEGAGVLTSVALLNKVSLYLTANYEASADSNMKYVVTDAATGEEIAQIAAEEYMTNFWRGVFDGVSARDMRKLLKIELYDNDVLVSKTLTWSIESYVAQTRDNASASDVLCGLVNAMLVYGDSAAAYMLASGQ